MRSIVLSLTTAMILALATISASAQGWRSNGGDAYQGGNPAYAEYRANCIDHLPRWGMRNPCQQANHGAVRGGMQRQGMHQGGQVRGGRQVQTHTWSRITTRRVFLGTERVYRGKLYVPRNGGKSIFVPVQ